MPVNGTTPHSAPEGPAPAPASHPHTPGPSPATSSFTVQSFTVQALDRRGSNEVVAHPDRTVDAPAPVPATPNDTTSGPTRAPSGDPEPVPATPMRPTELDEDTSAEHGEVVDTSTTREAGSTHTAPAAPPAPPPGAVRGASTRSSRELLERSLAALEPVTDAEAGPFAARFAADYLSFDQDDPALRAEVLRSYLADPDAALLGWSGQGRQRCEFVLPGRTLRTDDGVVVVEVTARVVTYDRSPEVVEGPGAGVGAAQPGPSSSIGRSCAPPPTGRGWVAGGAHWVQLAPPVRRHRTGRLVIDFGAPPAIADGGR